MLCIYTYSFLPQAPLGAVSSAAEDKDGKLMLEDISGAAFILTLELVLSISVSGPGVWSPPGPLLRCGLRGVPGPGPAASAGRHVGPAHHPGHRLPGARHHRGLRHRRVLLHLARVGPLGLLLVPGPRLLLLYYFSVLINLHKLHIISCPSPVAARTSVSSSSCLAPTSSMTNVSILSPE